MADPTGLEIAEIATALAAFYTAVTVPFTPSTTTVDSVDVTPLDGTSGAVHTSLALVGTNATLAVPSEVSEVLTIRTASRGRRARGRIFLPSITRDQFQANGHINTAYTAIATVAAAAMQTALGILGWQCGVASYGKSVKVNHTTTPKTYVVSTWDPFFTEANAFTMDEVADVIRNRKA